MGGGVDRLAEGAAVTRRARSIARSWLGLAAAMAALSGCSGFDLLNLVTPNTAERLRHDAPYGRHPRLTLDAYTPRGGHDRAGVVVFFHGGNWRSGDKGDYRFVADAFASRGFIVVLPNYRLYPEATFPTFVEDAAAAVRWTIDHAAALGGDPERVYLMGHSAGAHLVALLTLDERYLRGVGLERGAVRAAAALSGPYDFVPTGPHRAVFNLPAGEAAAAPVTQPIRVVDGGAPPLLLVHGLRDETVEPGNATRLAEAIRSAGGEVEVVTYPDRGHAGVVLSLAWGFRWLAPVLDDTAEFFRAHAAGGG